MQSKINELLSSIEMQDPKAVYAFGSRVYGTYDENSDYDFYVISDDVVKSFEYKTDDLNAHVYNTDQFNQLLGSHHIGAMECFFAPIEFKFNCNEDDFIFDLDLVKLRHSISQVCSNSFVKAKKKFEVENEPYIAKKSLFHSIRIAKFGTQIAKHGKIVEFSNAKLLDMYKDIMECKHTDWEFYKNKYKPIFNHYMSEFRKETPK